jgi:hypothetical protein
MSKPTIALDNELWAKVKQHCDDAGYSSPEEFVQHLIEKELTKAAEPAADEETTRKLHGIGYLDFGRDI